MNSIHRQSKEEIKNRMFKNAANFWGIKNINDLDPLVRLLIEALSAEMYKLSNEVGNIEVRILERISSILTPDILVATRPAHAILQVQSATPTATLNQESSFYAKTTNSSKAKKKGLEQVLFSPVNNVNIFKGAAKYMVCGRTLFSIEKGEKEILLRTNQRSEKLNNTVWLGLDLDKGIKDLKGLSFYFDFFNIEEKIEYFSLLPFAQWSIGGKQVSMLTGLHFCNNDENSDPMSLFTSYDLLSVVKDNIQDYYKMQFVTLDESVMLNNLETTEFPPELLPLFPESTVNAISESLYWVKISLPSNFTGSIVEEMHISINAFPVSNKMLGDTNRRLQEISSIIPIPTSDVEYFFSIESITDSKNRQYKQIPYKNTGGDEYGTYTIKRGGTERFDSRDASEYLSQLVDLLRDESASFSSFGHEYVQTLIGDLNQIISSVSKKVGYNKSKERESPSYVIINPIDPNDIIYLQYWTSNCEYANKIKSGTILVPYNDLSVENNAVLLTSSLGGQRSPRSSESLDAYKYVLTTRDRLVTLDDVLSFCKTELGDLINNVKVKKGVMVSPRPKEGLIRTIDIMLEMGNTRFSDNEWKEELRNKLERKSPEMYNYRIFIE